MQPQPQLLYTAAARSALAIARADADRAGHPYVATEHIVIGLMRAEGGVGGMALSRLGISIDAVVRRFAAILSAETHTDEPRIPKQPTSRTSLVLQLAAEDASGEGVSHIGTAHLLTALLREGGGVGAGVLLEFGATLTRVQVELARLTTQGVSEPSAAPGGAA